MVVHRRSTSSLASLDVPPRNVQVESAPKFGVLPPKNDTIKRYK